MESGANANELPRSAEMIINELADRLKVAIEALEKMIPRASVAAAEAVGPIVAMVEGGREAELEQKLAEAEKTIASLRGSAGIQERRRTLPVSLLAKQEGTAAESGALDSALMSLSLEQRIAVKSQLLRAGLL